MNSATLKSQLQQLTKTITHLRVVLFLCLLVLLYGFIVWRINSLVTAHPDEQAVASQSNTTSKPFIDQALVNKVKQLEDTNVTVKALFDQARKNPFRE